MNIRLSFRLGHFLARLMLGSCVFTALVNLARAQPVTLGQMVRLALSNSPAMAVSSADMQHAYEAWREARDMYIPQVTVGSGLAGTYGFPLSIEGSAPTVISVGTQSFLYNPAQKQFIKAAKVELTATTLQKKDQRNQVLLDTVLAYRELDKWQQTLEVLRAEQAGTQKMETIVSERIREGIDSAVEMTKAKLASARIRMRLAEAEGAVEVLRSRLSGWTGLPASSIETVSQSIPSLPGVEPQDDVGAKAVENNPVIAAADEHALSKEFSAKGEHRQLYPAVDLVGQYGLFAKYNGYSTYFRNFQPNNATAGVAIRLPIFNFPQRARAAAADAEALRSLKDAQDVRNKVATETIRLQRLVQQMAAARDVAQLEYELAQSNVEAASTKVQSGTGTLKEQANAQAQANDKFAALLDASFELDKAQLQLLRQTNELDAWALSGK
jgi:outer membrane protein TolC